MLILGNSKMQVFGKKSKKAHLMEVSNKNFLLQGPDIGVQEMKPMLLIFNLDHVDVSRWHVLISTLKSGILQSQTAFVQSLNISLMAGFTSNRNVLYTALQFCVDFLRLMNVKVTNLV